MEWTSEAIKNFRLSLGLTQAEFARALGLRRQQSISEWECGIGSRRPSSIVILNLLKERVENGKFEAHKK